MANSNFDGKKYVQLKIKYMFKYLNVNLILRFYTSEGLSNNLFLVLIARDTHFRTKQKKFRTKLNFPEKFRNPIRI